MKEGCCSAPSNTTRPNILEANPSKSHLSVLRTRTKNSLDRRSDCPGTRIAVQSRRNCRDIRCACPLATHNEANPPSMKERIVPLLHRNCLGSLLRTPPPLRAIRAFQCSRLAFLLSACTIRLSGQVMPMYSRIARMEHHCIVFPRALHLPRYTSRPSWAARRMESIRRY
jgi:hypothetical protein